MKLSIEFYFLISFLLLFSACEENPFLPENALYETEKYKVYSAIINSEFNDGFVFILDSTATGRWIRSKNPSYLPDTIQSIFTSLKSETIENYKSLNKTRTFIEDKFNVSINYEMISPGEKIDSSQYIVAIFDFTNVGFDKSYKQSLVYFGIIESRGGYGRFLFLEKDSENWIIKKSKYVWAFK